MQAITINPATVLSQCPEKQVGAWIPSPLSERLDALIQLADDAAARTNRKELLAALILAAPESGERLAQLVARYRRARAVDAALKTRSSKRVLLFQRHQPGPRRRSQNG